MTSLDLTRPALATLIALGLSYHGIRKKSLNISGAVAAIFVGFITFVCSYRFGLILILFYYVSSKLTKVREDIKSKLEDDYSIGGQRNWIQVFANSILATLICLVYYYYIGEDSYIDFSNDPLSNSTFRSKLLCVYVAHYACATGDTWASEVGILSTSKPRLITSLFLRQVPHGTNGGVSLLGTIASAAGGLFIGIVFWFMSYIVHIQSPVSQMPILLVGIISGFLGSLYDSFLGATLQASYYSYDRKCIIKAQKKRLEDKSIQLICGSDVLSNETVNFISILLTMITIFYLAPSFWL